jgi:flagellar hook assembly protein FlgD
MLTIEQNTPNPMNDNTNFAFRIPETAPVRLEVMDLLGNTVAIILNDNLAAGTYNQTWNGMDINGNALTNGAYIYKLTAGSKSVTAKLTIMK